MPEAQLHDCPSGLAPEGEGWFVVGARDAWWGTAEGFGFSWDFFHSPAGTAHVLVGAGDGPCVTLTAGARTEDEQVLYPVSDRAAQYGASVPEETTDPGQAYAPFGSPRLARPPSWADLPWAL